MVGLFIRFVLWAAVWGCCSSVFAADLTKVDRTIARLPQFKTERPEYCLLVFGAEVDSRVWLVRDGDVLYVDRNGNGDLTEPGERVEADLNTSHPDEDQFRFKCGSLRVGGLEHRDLVVQRFKLLYLEERSAKVAELLKRDPEARGYSLRLSVEVPGQTGWGLGGRVGHLSGDYDERGVLQFASRPEDAPILHCGGPLTVLCDEDRTWRIGEINQMNVGVGNRGLGAGATIYAEFKIIPAELKPALRVTFPPAAAGESPVVVSYELGERCCGYNLYGPVRVPANVGTGLAHVEVSLAGWDGTSVAPSSVEVNLVPPPAVAEVKPVSARLKTRLPHANKAMMFMIQFSPDGKELIASDWPANSIRVWDVATGAPRVTIEAGSAPSVRDLFAVTPDWKTVYAPRHKKPKTEPLERDGKTVYRVECDDEVRAWNLETGKPLPSLRDSPAHEIRSFRMSPDGRSLVTFDYLPGEVEGRIREGTTWWDLQTRQPRHLPAGVSEGAILTPDAKYLAFPQQISEENFHQSAICVYDVDSWTETFHLPIEGEMTRADPNRFGAGGKLLVADLMFCDSRDDYRHGRSELTGWDTSSGRRVFAAPTRDRGEVIADTAWSPDERLLAATGFQLESGRRARLYLVDVENNASQVVDFGEEVVACKPVFHPNGKWLAVGVHDFRKGILGLDLPPEDLLQPRIELIDASSGQIVETIYLPQSYMASLAISPDGKTLATSGHGEILLWDVSDIMGRGQ